MGNDTYGSQEERLLTDEQFLEVIQFTDHQRRFIKARQQVAHELGVEVQQHLALLTIRGLHLQQQQVTMSILADLLFLALHSTVELVDRLESRGLAYRQRDRVDLRRVFVNLTEDGDHLARLGATRHVQVIQEYMPPFMEVAQRILAWSSEEQ